MLPENNLLSSLGHKIISRAQDRCVQGYLLPQQGNLNAIYVVGRSDHIHIISDHISW